MLKSYTLTVLIFLASCSDGEQNTPSITDAILSRPYVPASSETSLTGLNWDSETAQSTITVGSPLNNENHVATDSNSLDIIYSIDNDLSSCTDLTWNPALSIDPATGSLTGTALSYTAATCDLVLKANTSMEEKLKTITFNVTDQVLIDEIISITLTNPLSSPGTVTTPTIELSPLTVGDTITLYSDSSCTTAVESFTASSSPESITLSTPLVDGSYDFYAMATNATNSSICSTAPLNYVLNTTVPDPATNLVFDSYTNSATDSPQMLWTASPTPNAEYRISFGTSVGADDILSDESAGTATSYTVTSGITLTECSPVYPTLHTYSDAGLQAADINSPNSFYYDNTAPSLPTSLSFSSDYIAGTSPTLNWLASTDNCATTVSYRVALGTAAGDDSLVAWTDVTGLSHFFDTLSLTVGDTVYMSVKAFDEAGLESTHDALSFVVPAAPDAPVLSSSAVALNEITLDWTTPNDNNRAITDYVIEFKESAAATWGVFTDPVAVTNSAVVNALLENTSYDFRVFATNGEQGPYSNVLTISTDFSGLSWDDPSTSSTILKGSTVTGETYTASDLASSPVSYSIDPATSNCDEENWNPPLALDSATGNITGTLLSYPGATCDLTIEATTGTETVSKTITYALTDQTLIAEITAIALSNPATSPGSIDTPTIDLSPVTAGDTLTLYSDAACSVVVETITASGSPESITLSSPLADGSHDFYAMATNATNSSICSTTALNYVLDTAVPDPATNLVFDSFTNIATESPLMSWTASPTANVEYRVSLGTSVGADDIVSDESAASATSYTVTSGLTLTECSPVFPTVHTYSTSGLKATDLSSSDSFYYDNTVPSDPSSLSFTSDYLLGTGPTLDWAASTDNCGASITYKVALGTSSGDDSIVSWTDVTTLNHSFTGLSLTIGDTIFMSVKAVDEAGLESAFDSLSFIVPDAPDAPVLSSPSVGLTDVNLDWTTPNDNNRAISDYIIEYKETSASTWTVFLDGVSVTNSAVVNGLLENTSYDFRVSASNGEQGDYSNIVSMTTDFSGLSWDDLSTSSSILKGSTLTGETYTASDLASSPVSYSIDLAGSNCDEESWNPPLGVDAATGGITGTLLSYPGATCDLSIEATTGTETISKTITYALTDQTLIAEITAISLSNPATSPGSIDTPTIDLSPVTAGDTITLYSDAACSVVVESVTASGSSESITLSAPLADGSHDFYAMATNATNSSVCSTTALNYVLDTAVPDPATNLVFDSFTNIATDSPLMSWTASPTANVEYRVSLGTSVGADDIVSDESAASATSYTVTSGMTLTECSPVYPTVHTYSSSGTKATDLSSSDSFYYDNTAPGVPSSLAFTSEYLLGVSPTLDWASSTDNCGASVAYKVALGTSSGDDSIIAWTDVTSLNHYFSGLSLTVGDTVFMSVKAIDEAGFESIHDSLSFVVPDAPDAPVLSSSSVGFTDVNLDWTTPNDNNRVISDYIIEYKETSAASWSVFADGVAVTNSAVVNSLLENTSYDFRVSASNGEQGDYSNIVTVTTNFSGLEWDDPSTSSALTTGSPVSGETYTASDLASSTVSYSLDLATSTCDDGTWNPALGIDSVTGSITGTLLSYGGATCDLAIEASSGSETITKTVSYSLTNQTLITEITSIILTNPATNPGNIDTPTIELSPVTSGDTISLYSDAGCTVLVESATASGSAQSITLSSALSDGSHDFYAIATNATNSSLCSTASLNYVLDTAVPNPATNLIFDSYTNSSTTSPSLSWTASSTANVEYRVSLGSSMGATDLINEESAGSSVSYTVTSGISLSECSPVYPTIHTYSDTGVQATDLSSSDYFYYDNTAPGAPSSLSYSSYYLAGTGPTLTWGAASDNCDTPAYQVAMGTAGGDDSIMAWTDVTSTNHSFSGLSLSVGDTIFMSVKALDAAGFESSVESLSFVVPDAPEAPILGYTSIGIDRVVLGWNEPADNERPITDYIVEYKLSSASSWTTFNDGINDDSVATVNSLTDDTDYNFRIKAFNGEDSSYSNTISVKTQINDPFFDDTSYKVMNIAGATDSRMVALEDATTVILADGVSTVSLNKGDTHSFASSQGDIIESDKPVFIAGRKATSNSDANKGNIVWSSPDWAGREFIFSVNRYSPHKLFAYMFDAGTLNVAQGNASPTSYNFSAGEFKEITITSNASFYVTSTQPALLYIYSAHTGSSIADPKPLLPSSNDIIGFPSNSAQISVDTDATSFTRYISDGSVDAYTGNKNATTQHTGTGPSTSSLYQGYSSRYTSTGGKLVANSLADSNGLCSAPFLPVSMMKKRYAINVSSDYVAFASTKPAVITITEPSGSTSTITLTRSGGGKSPYYGRIANVPGGTVFEASKRFATWYHPNTDTDAADNDETILFGFD